jgi:hypothetical protein
MNILYKQSRTTDKGRSSSLSSDEGLTTPHRKMKQPVTKRHTELGKGRLS